jgi:carbonic anhydrase
MTEDSMEMLLKRAVNFRRKDYENNKDLFNKLKEQQTPHTLFISCSDSRVDPNMITGSLPGELFTIRNIANIVPPFRESNNYVSTASAIEYAVLMLGVDNIIVCGHSDCGGCAAYLKPEEYLDEFPHTKKWLNLSHEVRDRVIKDITADDYGKRHWLMEQENVVDQLKNLLSYPYINERVKKGKLNISGWHYIIETGEIFIYDKTAGEFKLAN